MKSTSASHVHSQHPAPSQGGPCGCREYVDVSRRSFLGAAGFAAIAASVPSWLPRVAYASEGDGVQRDVLVSIFLRGGADGLTLCVPHGDPFYVGSRPTLHIPPPGSNSPFAATDLDGFFGVPPSMVPLMESYLAGHLLFVQATGLVDPTRSHFDAMHFMEVGRPRDPALVTGWLGRHLANTSPMLPTSLLRAVGLSPGLQRQLVGAPLAQPIPDLDDTALNGRWETRQERQGVLAQMYASTANPLRASAANMLGTMAVLDAINFQQYQPQGNASYPDSYFGYSLKCTAALIKAQVGVEAIAIDLGGWDTHEAQQSREGYMAQLMQDFAQGLAAFYRDIIEPGTHKTTLIAMSEFGRNVVENASQGTDHGHGNLMMLMGQRVLGGRVLRTWPGLAPDQLYEGQDLQITIDYRDVVAEVVQRRLNNPDLGTIFPGYTPTFRGVVT